MSGYKKKRRKNKFNAHLTPSSQSIISSFFKDFFPRRMQLASSFVAALASSEIFSIKGIKLPRYCNPLTRDQPTKRACKSATYNSKVHTLYSKTTQSSFHSRLVSYKKTKKFFSYSYSCARLLAPPETRGRPRWIFLLTSDVKHSDAGSRSARTRDKM